MLLPVVFALTYLAVNLVLMVWLERERAHGRAPADRVTALSLVLRFGPPLLGLLYLVTLAGDWLFFVFVLAFFAGAFWLMNGLAAFTGPGPRREAMRSGWDDRHAGAEMNGDRNRAP